MKKVSNLRAIACKILYKVVYEGTAFHPQLIHHYFPKNTDQNYAFIANTCFGVLRFYERLQAWIPALLHKPLKSKDFDIHLLIMVGLYQIFYTQAPAYAAVNETVAASLSLKKAWARGLINQALHQAIKKSDSLLACPTLLEQTAHPSWLVAYLQNSWPEYWQEIITANLAHPPLTLRVNAARITRSLYLQRLLDAQIEATALIDCPRGVILNLPCPVERIPGFNESLVNIQDGAAQLAADLLDLKPNLFVLDACAAPGSKTAHLVEEEETLRVWALEKDPKRFKLLENTRLRLTANASLTCLCADATEPEKWWQGERFDRILLDVPCSATGVIRRHPDIKRHRRPDDIPPLIALQKKLLTSLWPLLKRGGVLLYATCSVLPHENTKQIESFLSANKDAQEWQIEATWGLKQPCGRQILPGQHQMDGFYYARLIKT